MKLRDLNPELVKLNTEDLIQRVKYSYIFALMDQISEYYSESLALWKVLNYYGIPEPDAEIEQCQVSCLLVEHGSGDKHASARYFSFDRETGLRKEQVYCYKCSKILSSFWYIYKYEKDYHELNMKDVFIFIQKTFGVQFPKDLILEFDPEKFYTFDSEDDRITIMEKFNRADKIRDYKNTDIQVWLDSLINLYLMSNVK